MVNIWLFMCVLIFLVWMHVYGLFSIVCISMEKKTTKIYANLNNQKSTEWDRDREKDKDNVSEYWKISDSRFYCDMQKAKH